MAVGICCQQGTSCTWGSHCPPPGAGWAVGPVWARGSCPTVQIQFAPSLLFLWVPPQSLPPGMKLTLQRGRGRGWMGCWSPHTSHLSTLALGTWSLLSLVGTGPSWPSDPRPGSQKLPLFTGPVHLDTHFWPPLPFRNLGVPPQGSEWLVGRGGTPPVLRECLLLGTPVNQGHPGAREPGGLPRKRARRHPPSPAPARARSGPTRAGAEAICACLAVGPSVQHREAVRSKSPSGQPGRAAAPKEQARAGVAANHQEAFS